MPSAGSDREPRRSRRYVRRPSRRRHRPLEAEGSPVRTAIDLHKHGLAPSRLTARVRRESRPPPFRRLGRLCTPSGSPRRQNDRVTENPVLVGRLTELGLRSAELDIYSQPIGVHTLYVDPETGAEHYLI